MTEQEWLACTDPTPMLEFLKGKASDRKLRLLGCGCCRRVWSILPDYPTRRIVEVVERFVEGQESSPTVGRLRKQATRADTRYLHPYNLAVRKPTVQSTERVLIGAARFVAWEEEWGIREERRQAESAAQTFLLRDIFGNPFRPVAADPRWLTSTAVALARAIYDDRAFDRLPILADALEDAGCDNADILSHLRGDGPHVRGCWALDLVLGKE
jgi:hypothetical protein